MAEGDWSCTAYEHVNSRSLRVLRLPVEVCNVGPRPHVCQDSIGMHEHIPIDTLSNLIVARDKLLDRSERIDVSFRGGRDNESRYRIAVGNE